MKSLSTEPDETRPGSRSRLTTTAAFYYDQLLRPLPLLLVKMVRARFQRHTSRPGRKLHSRNCATLRRCCAKSWTIARIKSALDMLKQKPCAVANRRKPAGLAIIRVASPSCSSCATAGRLPRRGSRRQSGPPAYLFDWTWPEHCGLLAERLPNERHITKRTTNYLRPSTAYQTTTRNEIPCPKDSAHGHDHTMSSELPTCSLSS